MTPIDSDRSTSVRSSFPTAHGALFVLSLALVLLGGQSAFSGPNPPPDAAEEKDELLPEILPPELTTELVLTRVGADRWRAEYLFNRPVAGLLLGPAVAGYRREAWTILTPGVHLVAEDGDEALRVQGEPLTELALEVVTVTERPAGNYMPMARFSDGGRAVMLDFFTGRAVVDGAPESIAWRFALAGREGERTLLPDGLEAEPSTFPYAYFGPGEPQPAGEARLLLDPGTPLWLEAVLRRVVAAVSGLYAERLGGEVAPPLVWVAAGELDAVEDYSIKGGALGGQIYLDLRGRGLLTESSERRRMFEKLVAHELAHLWQDAGLPSGFNMEEPWIHEGGADALAVAALVAAGSWSEEDAARFTTDASDRCRAALGAHAGGTLPEALARGDWGAVYACGYGMFTASDRDPFTAWSAFAARARLAAEPYTKATLDTALAESDLAASTLPPRASEEPSSADADDGRPRISEPDRIRLAEAFALAADVQDHVWPGWSTAPFAVLLVSGENEFLVRHPAPSDDFAPLGDDPLLEGGVWVRDRQFSPDLLATFPAVGGVPAVVIGSAEATGKSSTDWVLTVLHEHFHQLQMASPGYYAAVAALDLSGGDETGMWMLDYPFPYDSVAVGERFLAYRDALQGALAAAGLPGEAAALAALAGARSALHEAIGERDARYLAFQLWQEGVARHIEHRVAAEAAARHRPLPAFAALPDYVPYADAARQLEERLQAELADLDLPAARRVAFYPLGALEAHLLDALRPGWPARYLTEPFALDRYLAPPGDR